jgi:hypothetical protein
MAKSRKPPNLRGTLGTLVRSTIEQVGAMRDVALRSTQTQRGWFDAAVLARKRREALADLGEIIYGLAASGRLDDELDRDVRAAIEVIDDLDARIAEAERRASGAAAEGFAERAGRPADQPRGRRSEKRRAPADVPVWRPVPPWRAPAGDDDSGETEAEGEADEDGAADEATAPGRAVPKPGAFISASWDDDDDLEEYMHEDDVPEPPAPTAPAPKSGSRSRSRKSKQKPEES